MTGLSFADLAEGIVFATDPCEVWLAQLKELLRGGKSYNDVEAELLAAGKPVPPMLAMLAREERAEHGDPRFDELRRVYRATRKQ